MRIPISVRLLVRCGSGFRCLLPITTDHDHTQERSHDCRPKECQNDWYANRPDPGGEKIVERVPVVHEGLTLSVEVEQLARKPTINNVQTV